MSNQKCWTWCALLALLTIGLPGIAAAECNGKSYTGVGYVRFFEHDRCNGKEYGSGSGMESMPDEWNDEVTSLIVGPSVKLIAYIDGGYNPSEKAITFWPGNYPDLAGWSDRISSFQLETIPADTPIVTLFADDKTESEKPAQIIQHVGPGDYNMNGKNQDQLLINGNISMISVPTGATVTLYSGYGDSDNRKFTKGDYRLPVYQWNDKAASLKVERPDYELAGVKQWKPMATISTDEREAVGQGVRCDNSKDLTQPKVCSLQVGKSISESATFGWDSSTSATIGVTVTAGVSGGVPGIGEASAEVSVSAAATQAFGLNRSTTSTDEKNLATTVSITALPGEVKLVTLKATPKVVEFYPEYIYQEKGNPSNQFTKKGVIKLNTYVDAETDTEIMASLGLANGAILTGVTLGKKLLPSEKYWTGDKKYYLMMQDDGNLVAYDSTDTFAWGSHNDAGAPLNGAYARLQPSGNFIIADADDRVIWQTGVENLQSQLTIENRQLRVIDRANKTIWPK